MKKKISIFFITVFSIVISSIYFNTHSHAQDFQVPNPDYSITNTDVTKYPYSSIVYFSKRYENGGLSRGTGVVVGKDYVLTAGHVNNGWESANIIPALKSNNTYPLGNWSGDRALSITSPNYVGGYPGDDYGLTKVNPRKESDGSYTHIGDVVKPLTVMPDTQNRTFFVGSKLATLGYPSFNGHTQYFSTYTITGFRGNYRIDGNLKSSGGNSGAPLLNDSAQVVGIYHGGGGVAAMNSQTKIPLLLSWGLKEETSRIYFAKDKSEWNIKRKLINPEGIYIERKNGQEITENEFSTMANQEVSKVGYHVTKLTDGVNVYETNKKYTMFIGGLTLYPAEYSTNNYSVTFDKNAEDVGGEMMGQVFTYDKVQKLSENKFVREGYTFSGWNTSADGTGDPYDDLAEVSDLSAEQDGKVTLYAQWVLNVDHTALGVHDSTIAVGDIWSPEDNFDYAKDSSGNNINFSSINVNGTVNTNIPGNYQVNYSYSGIKKIATITVSDKKATTIPIFRIYNLNDGDHLYTTSEKEYKWLTSLKWSAEDVAFHSVLSDYEDAIPVYRLYNPNSGEHFYTISESEYNNVANAGWKREQVGFYMVPKDKGVNVYRIFNPNATGPGSHVYTSNKSEADELVNQGWKDEDIAFYSAQ
ncbi:bacterial Ig-like domain-containing protein [Enterococcus sp. ALS3]|uniref:Bacterial Ig-like domain-containing protein n=1 Tax=Enterococcus alishanensis TaxID=1303817 RepID=A0ABS6THU5_9ENTE|nr:bacterial Ig-like domain-containing protein [Enterococcus alishanensis]MBV7392481.1 bacterial Ig-like domain-containing protein [Enterococcus alishanensis]